MNGWRLAWRLGLAVVGLGVTGVEARAAVRPNTNAVTISAGLVRGFPGSSVNVPVAVQHTGVVSAMQFDLDATGARMAGGALFTGTVSNQTVLRSRWVAPGRHRVLAYSRNQSALETNLNVGAIPFSVAPGDLAGGGPVRITNPLVVGSQGAPVTSIRRLNGGVLVGPVFRDADGVVDLFLTVQSNRTYVIQATTDFSTWETLATNAAIADYLVFKDLDAAEFPQRFYRAIAEEELARFAGAAGGGGTAEFVVGGFVAMSFPAVIGRAYVVQTTTNLVEWEAWSTNVSATSWLRFTNAVDRAVSRRFFRVVEQ